MPYSEWSQLFLICQFTWVSSSDSLRYSFWFFKIFFQRHWLWLVLFFFIFWKDAGIYPIFLGPEISLWGLLEQWSFLVDKFLFFLLLIKRSDQSSGLVGSDPLSSQNSKQFHDSFSRTDSSLCIHKIVWSKFVFTVPSGSSSTQSHVYFCCPSEPICCICLLYSWLFHLSFSLYTAIVG